MADAFECRDEEFVRYARALVRYLRVRGVIRERKKDDKVAVFMWLPKDLKEKFKKYAKKYFKTYENAIRFLVWLCEKYEKEEVRRLEPEIY